jgi:transcriptional regulator with XRE-family HTH domain
MTGVRRLLAQALLSSQAMIPTAVPSPDRLIALLRHRALFLDFGLSPAGFSEPERQRLDITTGRGGRSAKARMQSCGKDAASAFDVQGLVQWIRQKFPRYTSVNVEASTGISAATVENWLQGRSLPSIEHFSIMLMAFGPSFLRAAMSGDAPWIAKAEADALAAEIEAEIEELERRRAALMERAKA